MNKIPEVQIAERTIGPKSRPFIVAEMSGNHNQSLERALELVNAAAQAGAHALKIQTYTADTMTLDREDGPFFIRDKDSLWKGSSLYRLYQQAATPYDWHKPIFDRCKELGMIGFSSPFDTTAVDFLESLDTPAYKIASPEIIDLALVSKAASTGKPLILSTGMATAAEIEDAVWAAKNAGCRQIVLLKCTTSYPAPPTDANILTIAHMRDLFQLQVGLSDHTLGVGVAVASVALGASVIEKHFTLSRSDGGVDSAFSLEPAEFRSLVIETERAWQSLGQVFYGPTESEKKSLGHRRSLYIVKALDVGEILSASNVRSIRPGYGLAPKYLERIFGKKVNQKIPAGTPLSWDMIG